MLQKKGEKIDLLKNLLLDEDRLTIDALKLKIKELESSINQKEKLSEKVNPIITERLEQYTEDIPETLGPSITESLRNEIANSKDQVVDALYPILGKMIKKYIQQEFKILSEKINAQVQKSFSIKNWVRKFKSSFTGVKEESLIIQELVETEIHEIFIIDMDSGILKANYSKTKTIDKNVISGMLTAIKGFIEEAFKTGEGGKLHSIEYDLYSIHLQNFKSYYIAVVLYGVFDSIYQNKLENKLLKFSKKHLQKNTSEENLSAALKNTFTNGAG